MADRFWLRSMICKALNIFFIIMRAYAIATKYVALLRMFAQGGQTRIFWPSIKCIF